MATELPGKTAIVTGASSGIGRETAHALAAEGANVVLAARSEDRITTLADELSTEAIAVPTNVREESEVEALIETTVERFGGIDVLVNNAGIGS